MKNFQNILIGMAIISMSIVGCSNSSSESPVDSSTGHVHHAGEAVQENVVAATCEESGSYDLVTYCTECQEEISREHKTTDALGHDYTSLYEEVLPSYSYDGYLAHYECNRCHKVFDENKHEVTSESIVLPKAGDNIALSLNGIEKGVFTLVEKDENEALFNLNNIVVEEGDVVALSKPNDPTYLYSFFGNGNIDEDNKIYTAGTVDFTLGANANGFHLSISGYKYKGLVVKVNENEYPLHKVTYLEGDKDTYIYGYHYFNVNDVMTVVDNVNHVTYDYDDLENDTTWNTFDFHRGTNGEIVFDYQARFGIEFDRGGDKKVSIVKAFAPHNGASFSVQFDSERPLEALSKTSYASTSETYKELTWYIANENVINNIDMLDFLNTNGLDLFTANVALEANEKFNIKDLTNNSTIKGEHLVSIYGSSLDFASIDGDYVKITKAGNYTIEYVPSFDAIAIYAMESTVAAGYMMQGGSFVPGQSADGLVVYNNVSVSKNDYVAFTDASYNLLTLTLDSSSDSTLVRFSSYLVYLNKTGVFNFKVNPTTSKLIVEVVSIEDDPEPEELTSARIMGSKGLSDLMTENPDNTAELCIKDIAITGTSDGFYVTFYKADFSGAIEGVTLDESSKQYATSMSTLFYITSDGTYDFFLNKTTLVLRIVKH